MVINEAHRLAAIQEYYFSKKLSEIKRLNENGARIVNIGIGSPDLQPHQSVVEKLSEEARKGFVHGYQGYRGTDQLRSAIAAYYLRDYTIELGEQQILPLMGSKEGIMQITQAFVNEGDTVLVPDPGYPTYRAVSKLARAGIVTYHLTGDNGFQPDLMELERLTAEGIKILWMNFPNMPTGVEPDREVMEKIVQLAKERSFLIVNDNPYSRILTSEPFSIFQIPGAEDVALELNSLSKSHNMAGWRIGWVCGKKEYIDSILKVRSNMDSGMFYALQEAAVKALELDQDWFETINQVYEDRRKLIQEMFDVLDCKYTKDSSGLFVWAKVPDSIRDVESFVDELILQAEVFITPGKIFGKGGDRYLRASLCTPVEVLEECLVRVRKFKKEES